MVNAVVKDGVIQDTEKNTNVSSLTKDTKKNNTDLDVNDFLQLLVAQMQYQDPLEPTDNTQYIAQMATFTQVSATTDMNAKVQQQMASELVGKNVIVKSNIDSTDLVAGKVQSWEKIEGKIYLRIDQKLYDIEDLDMVLDEEYYDSLAEGEAVTPPENEENTGNTSGTETETDSETDSDINSEPTA